jgi:hypothetical protein
LKKFENFVFLVKFFLTAKKTENLFQLTATAATATTRRRAFTRHVTFLVAIVADHAAATATTAAAAIATTSAAVATATTAISTAATSVTTAKLKGTNKSSTPPRLTHDRTCSRNLLSKIR